MKIQKLKYRIKESHKNHELSMMKLDYFAKLLEDELEKREKEIGRISKLIEEYRN